MIPRIPNGVIRAFLFVTAVILLGCHPYAASDELPAPSEAEFEKAVGGSEVLRILQHADRVEAVRVHLDTKARSDTSSHSSGVIKLGKEIVLSPEIASQAKALLADRNTYFAGYSMCIFDPGIELLFKNGNQEVALLLCLKCADVAVSLGGKQVGFTSFARTHEKMIRFGERIFPDDKEIKDLIASRAAAVKEQTEDETRWYAGMPKSIEPIWRKEGWMNMSPIESRNNLSAFRESLAKQFQDPHRRILALLGWYGSGAGPWSGYPMYEEIPDKLLLEYPTSDLIAAIGAAALTEQQTEGAARLFADWDFRHQRPNDIKLLPENLKHILLQHALKSADTDKRGRAQNAFLR